MYEKSVATYCVTIDLKCFSNRLRDAAFRQGISKPSDLAEILKQSGHKITLSSVQKHWFSRMIPRAESLVGYSQVLKVSADWLLTGVEPPKPTISQLKQIVGEMIETQGAQISEVDAVTLEVDKLLSRLKSVDAKQQILRMIKGYVELEERGE